MTVQEVADVVQEKEPGNDVTVYEMIDEPFEVGAIHESATEALPTTPVGAAGASGTVAGVVGVEGSEEEEEPNALEAVRVNVYDVPLVKPEIVQEVELVVQVKPPGVEVTV